MPLGNKVVKVPMGLREAWFIPITAEPENSHPTYGTPRQVGGNVKAALAVTTASGSVYSDDVEQLRFEAWLSAQLDAETSVDDLEINAELFGHSYDSNGVEDSGADDVSPLGAYAFIQDIILKDKSHVYRATYLYKTSAMPSSEALDGQTRSGNFDPKMNAISYAVQQDNAGKWRRRREFTSQAAASAWIQSYAGTAGATTYVVAFNANGHGTAPESQTVYVGDTAVEPDDPTATGYTFGGWYTEAECLNAWNWSTPITGSVTLYAKWTAD